MSRHCETSPPTVNASTNTSKQAMLTRNPVTQCRRTKSVFDSMPDGFSRLRLNDDPDVEAVSDDADITSFVRVDRIVEPVGIIAAEPSWVEKPTIDPESG